MSSGASFAGVKVRSVLRMVSCAYRWKTSKASYQRRPLRSPQQYEDRIAIATGIESIQTQRKNLLPLSRCLEHSASYYQPQTQPAGSFGVCPGPTGALDRHYQSWRCQSLAQHVHSRWLVFGLQQK